MNYYIAIGMHDKTIIVLSAALDEKICNDAAIKEISKLGRGIEIIINYKIFDIFGDFENDVMNWLSEYGITKIQSDKIIKTITEMILEILDKK
jgi:hypothetical protein